MPLHRLVLVETVKIIRRRWLIGLASFALLLVVLTQVGLGAEARRMIRQNEHVRAIVFASAERGELSDEELQQRLMFSEERARELAREAEVLAFPRSMQTGLQTHGTVGILFVALGGALVMSGELSGGTAKVITALHRRRTSFFLALLLSCIVLSVVLVVATAVVSLVLGSRMGSVSVSAPRLVGVVGTSLLVTWAWLGVGVFLGALTRTTAAAVVSVVGFWAVNLLGSVIRPLYAWTLDAQAIALLRAPGYPWTHGFFAPSGYSPALLPPQLRALAVLLLVSAATLVASRFVFERADLR